jgi:hypothetical protein
MHSRLRGRHARGSLEGVGQSAIPDVTRVFA